METQGTISIRAFTSRAQIPIQGATAAVTRPTGQGRHQLVALRVTDENGLTQPVALPAPALSQSDHPGGERPFSVCDIWVEHTGYRMLHVEGVQIFPGVETRQDAELLPLPEHPTAGDMTTVVDVTPQPL